MFPGEKATDTVRPKLRGQYLRPFVVCLFVFPSPWVKLYKRSLLCNGELLFDALNFERVLGWDAWEFLQFSGRPTDICDSGTMITTEERCGCSGNSCLSNNLPLVHLELRPQLTYTDPFSITDFWLHFSTSSVSRSRPVAGTLVFPSDLTCADNLMVIA